MDTNLNKNILKWLSNETRESYLKIALEFFREINFDNRNEFVKLLNRQRVKYVNDLLFALLFYQYFEKNIDEDDVILRPVFLICLIDGIEEEKSPLLDVQKFFRNLANKDKVYLLNNLETLQGKGKDKHLERIYYDLIRKNKIYDHNTNYEEIDNGFKEINKYTDKLAEHFCNVRHFVLHEAKPITSAALIDKTYGLSTTISSYKKKTTIRKGHIKKIHHSFLTRVEISELRKIIKRGILKKIKKE